MQVILIVGVGGFVGAVMRYLVAGWVQDLFRSLSFPYGIVAVNVIGCLLIGVVAGLAESRSFLTPEVRALVIVGLLGGFTTFSAFSYESFELLRNGQSIVAFSNIFISIAVGLVAVWVGYYASQAAYP